MDNKCPAADLRSFSHIRVRTLPSLRAWALQWGALGTNQQQCLFGAGVCSGLRGRDAQKLPWHVVAGIVVIVTKGCLDRRPAGTHSIHGTNIYAAAEDGKFVGKNVKNVKKKHTWILWVCMFILYILSICILTLYTRNLITVHLWRRCFKLECLRMVVSTKWINDVYIATELQAKTFI